MRREVMVAALVAFPVLACSPTAQGDGQAPAAERGTGAVAAAPQGLKSDVFSGCVDGRPARQGPDPPAPEPDGQGLQRRGDAGLGLRGAGRGGPLQGRQRVHGPAADRDHASRPGRSSPACSRPRPARPTPGWKTWKVLANCELKLACGERRSVLLRRRLGPSCRRLLQVRRRRETDRPTRPRRRGPAAAATVDVRRQRGGLSEGLRRSRRPRRLARVIASSPKRFVTSSRTLSSGEGALGSSKRASWGFASPKWEA